MILCWVVPGRLLMRSKLHGTCVPCAQVCSSTGNHSSEMKLSMHKSESVTEAPGMTNQQADQDAAAAPHPKPADWAEGVACGGRTMNTLSLCAVTERARTSYRQTASGKRAGSRKPCHYKRNLW